MRGPSPPTRASSPCARWDCSRDPSGCSRCSSCTRTPDMAVPPATGAVRESTFGSMSTWTETGTSTVAEALDDLVDVDLYDDLLASDSIRLHWKTAQAMDRRATPYVRALRNGSG